MAFTDAVRTGVQAASRAVASAVQPIAWTTAAGASRDALSAVVETDARLTQSASAGTGARTIGYRLTVFGPASGLTVGDLLTIEGAPRRVVDVRGVQADDGGRFVTEVRAASHGPIFDPAFFSETIQIARRSGAYGADTFTAAVDVPASVQGAETVGRGRLQTADATLTIYVAGATAVAAGDRVTVPGRTLPVTVQGVTVVYNPADGLPDHKVITV